ncbi:MAG TPA: hypothetical protein VE686_05790 [Beijerinckiaceae bacterium]|nr:hypothetical protein [Beijerinckiaceae bacterium]
MLGSMTTVDEIERAVSKLPPEELAAFRAWFERFEAAQLDERIVRDVSAGRLDGMAEDAVAALRAARST